jgi:hypothetical protein
VPRESAPGMMMARATPAAVHGNTSLSTCLQKLFTEHAISVRLQLKCLLDSVVTPGAFATAELSMSADELCALCNCSGAVHAPNGVKFDCQHTPVTAV